MPRRLPSPRRALTRLACFCAALSVACGGRDYSWYCDRLNDTPSRWTFSLDRGGAPWFPVPLRFDFHAAQTCGDGCTCTISPFVYERFQGGNSDFGFYNGERCRAPIACTWSSGSLSADLIAEGNEMSAEGSVETNTQTSEFLYLYAQAVSP